MECPVCGQPMRLTDKDTSSGRDMRSYYCDRCKQERIVDNGVALWQVLHDANQANEAEKKPWPRFRRSVRSLTGKLTGRR
jgi:hypothetical protein